MVGVNVVRWEQALRGGASAVQWSECCVVGRALCSGVNVAWWGKHCAVGANVARWSER